MEKEGTVMENKLENKMKNYIILITYTVFILYAVFNLSYILSALNKLIVILSPFMYGFIIAYIINRPYEFFKKQLFSLKNRIASKTGKKLTPEKNSDKLINVISIILSYSIFLCVILFIFIAIAPQLIMNLKQFIDNFSTYSDSFIAWSTEFSEKFKLNILFSNNYMETILKNLTGLSEKLVSDFFPGVFSFTKNFAIGIYNWIIGLIVSLYLIGGKEKLLKQMRILSYSYIPPKFMAKVFKIVNLIHENFGKFLMGKILDSLIVGILCFLGTSILQIPYTLLISVVVTITNIIPFFGPFIGAIPCIIMLLIVNHTKALWFAIFIFILQQIDANIIGPKVLGDTVGISGFWILFSVIAGGGLFGIPGMIMGVPIFAVIYTIISEHVYLYRFKNFNK